MAIVNPLHVRVSSQPTWRVTVSTICGVWIVVALFAIPSALSNFICSGRVKEVRNIAYYKHVFKFELCAFCVLPLCVIVVFYIMTARHLVKRSDPIFEETQNPQLSKRKNIAKYVMVLTVIFLISYVPYHTFWAYLVFISDRKFHPSEFAFFNSFLSDFLLTTLASYCFFLINSSLNPVALFCTSSRFRKHLKHQLCCCCKTNSPPTNIELNRIN
jgi:hypothetical protein